MITIGGVQARSPLGAAPERGPARDRRPAANRCRPGPVVPSAHAPSGQLDHAGRAGRRAGCRAGRRLPRRLVGGGRTDRRGHGRRLPRRGRGPPHRHRVRVRPRPRQPGRHGELRCRARLRGLVRAAAPAGRGGVRRGPAVGHGRDRQARPVPRPRPPAREPRAAVPAGRRRPNRPGGGRRAARVGTRHGRGAVRGHARAVPGSRHPRSQGAVACPRPRPTGWSPGS
jgi:hypothetical protein